MLRARDHSSEALIVSVTWPARSSLASAPNDKCPLDPATREPEIIVPKVVSRRNTKSKSAESSARKCRGQRHSAAETWARGVSLSNCIDNARRRTSSGQEPLLVHHKETCALSTGELDKWQVDCSAGLARKGVQQPVCRRLDTAKELQWEDPGSSTAEKVIPAPCIFQVTQS